mmetsp:Transcript_3010/g.4457  ORF Transcript_3010/g.4457 Transcript_3010/m.4457 type:complete len:1007 (+) Transcript_3010:63-3083(+)
MSEKKSILANKDDRPTSDEVLLSPIADEKKKGIVVLELGKREEKVEDEKIEIGSTAGERVNSDGKSMANLKDSTASLMKKKTLNAQIPIATRFGYEYCIVVKDFIKSRAKKADKILEHRKKMLFYLLKDIESSFSYAKVVRSTEDNAKYLLLLVAVSNKDLSAIADRTNTRILLDPAKSHARGYELDLELAAHFEETEDVWKSLYAPFEKDFEHLFSYRVETLDGKKIRTRFKETDRLNIIDYVINDEDLINGLNLDERYAAIFKSAFPLHKNDKRQQLLDEWVELHPFCSTFCCSKYPTESEFWTFWPLSQPIDKIENYLGQKIAFYFEFLRVYTMWLLMPAIVGLGIFIYQQFEGIDNIPTAVFALAVCLNFMCYEQHNEQNEANLAALWGSSEVTETDKLRPEYKGEVKWSNVDGSLQVEQRVQEKRLRNLFGGLAIVGIIVFIYGSLISGYLAEQSLEGTLASGLVFAVMLTIVNYATRYLAYMLTEFENPKTLLSFRNSLILKFTLFKFMTGFGLLYYSAFLLEPIDGHCGDNSCEARTADLLRGTFVGMIFINNFLELATPAIKTWFLRCKRAMGEGQDDSENPVEQQLYQDEYGGTLDDYDEIVNQIGFTAFFVPFFPIAPLLAVVNNFIEIRVDSMKILFYFRRPVPERASGSGPWLIVIQVLSYIMLVTNTAALSFRFNSVPRLFGLEDSVPGKFLLFIVMTVGMLLIRRFFIEPSIPKNSRESQQRLERQEFLWPYLLGIKKKNDDLEFSYEFNLTQIYSDGDGKGGEMEEIDSTETTTFFSGWKSDLLSVYIMFKNGEIVDIDMINRHPAEVEEPLCSCCDSVPDMEAEHKWANERKSTYDESAGMMTDGVIKLLINDKNEEIEEKHVNNVRMRFEKDKEAKRLKLVGLCFDVDGKEEKGGWIGKKKGGIVKQLLQTKPSTGDIGRPGTVVAVKGLRDSKMNFLALEWMMMVFPKDLRESKRPDSIVINVIDEGGEDYKTDIIPHLPHYYEKGSL